MPKTKKIRTPKNETTDAKNIISALTEISEAIASDLYLDDILRLIVNVTARGMGSKICSLLLLDKTGKELVVKATQSVSDAYNKKPNIKIGEGIAGKVAKEVKPITVPDVRKDKNYINTTLAKRENLCSLLCVPLAFKNKAIGVLNIYTSKPHIFTKNEISILKSIANQAAVVIENFRLIVESKVIKEELESRKTIEKAKGILMRQEHLGEEEAYNKIRKYSMDNRRTMREISEAIILSEDIKKPYDNRK